MKNSILLVTPPLLQPNTAYPATAYLKGYLEGRGYSAEQFDLSIELLSAIFTSGFLKRLFDGCGEPEDENTARILRLRKSYEGSVDTVMAFLRGEAPEAANLICSADYLPQAGRFEQTEDIEAAFGSSGMIDCAKYLSTLYLEDICDFIRATAAPHFGLARYGEKIALSLPSFSAMEEELRKPANMVEEIMTAILAQKIEEVNPAFVGFTVPFPGNLLSTLRCAGFLRESYPDIKIIIGGGYPTTELRSITDTGIFRYVDYIVLDDGEEPIDRILSGGELLRTYTLEGKSVVYHAGAGSKLSHRERGCPDFSGLPFGKYISLTEVSNPIARLWGDGRWNKIAAAHGCYWSGCTFCDTSLDYICGYDAVDAATLADWMERISQQTGSNAFHFIDEALPPKTVKELSLEILRRGMKVSWWGNIRFEKHYTGDLCQLMAAAGCIAVSGGIEVASDRLLGLINKGITLEQLTITLRNFYYAGIMTHAYLMYGFPTQTYQETIDSLEVVRQLFRAELIGSAFWHRYAMTRHSPSGNDPASYGVRIKNNVTNRFANNEVDFAENRNYDISVAGDALRKALYNYIRGEGLDKPVEKWFEHKAPATEVDETFVTDNLIKPDSSRIYSGDARLVWIGTAPVRRDEGISLCGNSKESIVKLTPEQSGFIVEITSLCGDLNKKTTLDEVKIIYEKYSGEPFSYLYHSKQWDVMRGYGLLQL